MKRPSSVAAVVALIAVVALAAVTYQPESRPASSLPTTHEPPAASPAPTAIATPEVAATAAPDDGALPPGASALDDRHDGVVRLRAELLDALRRATTDASAVGVTVTVNSGWRSAAHQQRLFDDAVTKYGSPEAATRWVAPVERSAHVTGDAVDVGPSAAASWLAVHGAAYGLCPIYRNEPWHFELRPDAAAEGCPPMYEDPTSDPRMQP